MVFSCLGCALSFCFAETSPLLANLTGWHCRARSYHYRSGTGSHIVVESISLVDEWSKRVITITLKTSVATVIPACQADAGGGKKGGVGSPHKSYMWFPI